MFYTQQQIPHVCGHKAAWIRDGKISAKKIPKRQERPPFRDILRRYVFVTRICLNQLGNIYLIRTLEPFFTDTDAFG